MSGSLMNHITIRTPEECYCAICGVPFEHFLFQNRLQIAGEQPPLVINGRVCGYSPKVLSKRAALWLGKVHILGYANDEGIPILSGQGRLTTPGFIKLEHSDPRNHSMPFTLSYTCYQYMEDSVTVYPFHWPCYEIFASYIFPNVDDPTSLMDIEEVDSVFASLSNEEHSLQLETGAERRYGRP
ncbi:hypothetical protein F4776DRAFT_501237 [Hypoxylon sp. NC0597]|nr:hypothetical protein F4776DRAFT_501237 [Hypoxylon sp. NC0597]